MSLEEGGRKVRGHRRCEDRSRGQMLWGHETRRPGDLQQLGKPGNASPQGLQKDSALQAPGVSLTDADFEHLSPEL